MSVKAISKNVRISPRKVAIVAALVRGRSVDDALVILEHTKRRSAIAISKTIKSAKANALHNHNYASKGLVITEISVSPSMSLKRYRPAARGSANPFKRSSAHIRVIIDGTKREEKKTVDTKPKEKK